MATRIDMRRCLLKSCTLRTLAAGTLSAWLVAEGALRAIWVEEGWGVEEEEPWEEPCMASPRATAGTQIVISHKACVPNGMVPQQHITAQHTALPNTAELSLIMFYIDGSSKCCAVLLEELGNNCLPLWLYLTGSVACGLLLVICHSHQWVLRTQSFVLLRQRFHIAMSVGSPRHKQRDLLLSVVLGKSAWSAQQS